MSSSGMLLLVDDQPEMRRLLRRLLRDEGHPLREAAGGEEALALARSLGPALLVLDCEMPGLDGPGVLTALRSEGFRAPVLMISAHMDSALASRLDRLGASRCLSKLELGARLVPAIAELLRESPAAREQV
ncbi:MAG: response regulator transcription factor [Myxococcales bacterium]